MEDNLGKNEVLEYIDNASDKGIQKNDLGPDSKGDPGDGPGDIPHAPVCHTSPYYATINC